MARLSRNEKLEYRLEGDGESCYFCKKPGVMWNYTPDPGATDAMRVLFEGEKVRVKCCDYCWRKIYTVNMAKGGVAYGVQRGMMTLDQKRHLLGMREAAVAMASNQHSYAVNADKYLLPSDMLSMGDDKYLWKGQVLYKDELTSLQGPIAIRTLGLASHLIELGLLAGLNTGDLDEAKISVYRDILGLPS